MDCPGHYFRRIKSVAMTIPCITGPYTSVNCTLTLQKSSIRTSTNIEKGYPRDGYEDNRFNDYYGSLQSIVTSSGQSDSGLFETNLKDERYLPFERAGIAGSQWQLNLPSDVKQFDFDTITDVILHVRYTAREGGDILKVAAVQNLKNQINKAQTVGSVRLFSVRHEFPNEWAKFQSKPSDETTPPARLSLILLPEHYPFWAQEILGKNSVKRVDFFAEMLPLNKTKIIDTVNIYDTADKSEPKTDALNLNPSFGNLLSGNLVKISLPEAINADTTKPWILYFDNNKMKELWMAITWGRSKEGE
jgi:hypothetical protein